MAVTWVKGTFTRPAGTGTQTIDTGSGVVGKAVILFWTNQTTSGFDESSGHKVLGVGVAASPSQRGCISNVVQNGVDPANVGKGYFTDRVIEVFSDSTPTQESVADFDSFGTGGNAGKFTVNWTENPGGASAIIIHYTFIGGSDVSGAFVGGFTGPTATGNRSYTGVGFQGKIGIFLNTNQTATGSATGASFGMGSAESTSRRWAWACCANDNTNVQQLRANFSTLSSCLLSAKHGSAQADLISDNKADFISWDSDGFTLNHTKVTTSSVRFLGLILGGTFSGRVGSLNLPGVASETDSPSLLSVSMGFRPRGVAFLSTNSSLGELDEEPADYDYGINLGGFDEDGTQGIANLDYETDGGTVPMAAATTTKTTSCWASIDPEWPPGGPPTAGGIEEEVVWTSTNDDGFTVEQIVPSPNGPFVPPGTAQRYVTYIAIGDGGQAAPPSLRVKHGSVVLRDNQYNNIGFHDITGLDFQPKAVIFWRSRGLANGNVWVASTRESIGLATKRGASVQQGCIAWRNDDNVSTTNTMHSTRNESVWWNGTNNVQLDSMDADGFTLSYNVALATERLFWLAIGGTDAEDAIVLLPTMNTSGTDQIITGAGFRPDCALFLYANTAHVASGQNDHMTMSFGAASSASSQWCVAVCADDAVTTTGAMDWNKILRTDACMYSFTTGGAQDANWSLASFDSDGLTLTINDAPATASTIGVMLLLKGGRYKAGTQAKATEAAPLDDAFTGIGFSPSAVLFANTHQTSSNSIQAHENFAIGAASSKDGSQEGASAGVGGDAVLPTQVDQYDTMTKAVITAVHGSTPSVLAAGDMKSYDTDGFTVRWTTNDATADIIAYLAFGTGAFVRGLSDGITISEGIASAHVVSETEPSEFIYISAGLDGGRVLREIPA